MATFRRFLGLPVSLLLLVLGVTWLSHVTNGARVLLVPLPDTSQCRQVVSIGRELQTRGHRVRTRIFWVTCQYGPTFLTAPPPPSPPPPASLSKLFLSQSLHFTSSSSQPLPQSFAFYRIVKSDVTSCHSLHLI